MNSVFFIAKNNLKKKKRDVILLIILISITAALLYSALTILFATDSIMESAYDRANSADVIVICDENYSDDLYEIFNNQDMISYTNKYPVVLNTFDYRSSLDEEKNSFTFLVSSIQEERDIHQVLVNKNDNVSDEDIYISYYLKSSYDVGDTLYFTFGDKEYKFVVKGYMEDPFFNTPINVSIYRIGISEKMFSTLTEINVENSYTNSCELVGICTDKSNTQKAEDEFVQQAQKNGIPAEAISYAVNWNTLKAGGRITSDIGMGIISVFSFLLLLITFVIVRYSIRGFIEKNIKNIGILNAQGYTLGQLVLSSVFEMAFVSFFSALIGAIIGAAFGQVIGNIEVTMMIGLPYYGQINYPVLTLVVSAITILVSAVTYLSNRKLSKVTILDMLRGGIASHNFRKNIAPLDKARGPLAINLAWKSLLGEKKKTISIMVIAIILSYVACIGVAMATEFISSDTRLLSLIGVEYADCLVSSEDLKLLDEIREDISGWNNVKSEKAYTSLTAKIEGPEGEENPDLDIWIDCTQVENDIVLEGRLPETDNEIVLSNKIAKDLGASLGDIVYVTIMDNRQEFVVCGIDQKVNHLGRKAMINMEGAKRMSSMMETTLIYVELEEGATYDGFSSEILEKYPDASVKDYGKTLNETSGNMIKGVKLLCTVFLLIVIIITVFVEALVINSRISQDKHNLGVNKALGYTSNQLMVQIGLSNIPVVILGALLGGLFANLTGGKLIALFFSFCGLKKFDLSLKIYWILFVVIGISFVAFLASYFSAGKIKKIEPARLLMED